MDLHFPTSVLLSALPVLQSKLYLNVENRLAGLWESTREPSSLPSHPQKTHKLSSPVLQALCMPGFEKLLSFFWPGINTTALAIHHRKKKYKETTKK